MNPEIVLAMEAHGMTTKYSASLQRLSITSQVRKMARMKFLMLPVSFRALAWQAGAAA